MKWAEHNTKSKTTGERAADAAIIYVVALVFVFVISELAKFLSRGLKNPAKIAEDMLSAMVNRIEKRNEVRQEYACNENNPLTLYVKGEDRYKEWHRRWLNGEVLDTNLLWAPEVYLQFNEEEKVFNGAFVNYLEVQIALHEKANMVRHLERTLRKYYPEFASSISETRKDIVALRERIVARKLQEELCREIMKTGLDRRMAFFLIRKGGKNLKEQAKTLYLLSEKCEFSEDTCMGFLNKGYKLSKDFVTIVQGYNDHDMYLSDETYEAVLGGRISLADLIKISAKHVDDGFEDIDSLADTIDESVKEFIIYSSQ